jgi:hypothetical protein
VSAVVKPDPVTVTVVPVGPKLGDNATVRNITVNGTEIDPCSTAPPEIVTVCAPKLAVL